jgi:hypothetical protein
MSAIAWTPVRHSTGDLPAGDPLFVATLERR